MSNKRRSKSQKTIRVSFFVILIVAIVVGYYLFNNFDMLDFLQTGSETENSVTPSEQTQTSIHPGEYTSSNLAVYFFDVGQADSILLVTDGMAMLVDTGNAGDADTSFKVSNKINLSHELNRLGISTIDYMIATHPHEDHMGSMYKILRMFDVRELYANNILPEDEWTTYYRRFVEALEESNTHLVVPTTLTESEIIQQVEEYNSTVAADDRIEYNPSDYFRVGDKIQFGNALITILAPNSASYSDTNDYSIVLLVEFEDVRLLLTGDAGVLSEREMLEYASRNGINLDCNILKVGHHGSRTASSEAFISAVRPEHAIVMVAKENSYGLPDEDVIERLERYGSTIYMTKDYSDILLVIDDGSYSFDLEYSHEER
jgi:competence protein ComEC